MDRIVGNTGRFYPANEANRLTDAPPMIEFTAMAVFAPILNYLWNSASDFGLEPGALFREAGIDPKLRLDVNARVDSKQFYRMMFNARQESHDDAFVFHLVEHLHPSYFGALGYAWLSSASLRKGLERLQRYQQLLADEKIIRLENHEPELHVLLDESTFGAPNSELRETMHFAHIVKLCRMNSGESFKPGRIQFRRQTPKAPAAYFQFFRCDLQFSSDLSMLVIDSETADLALPGFNAQLEDLLEKQIIEYMTRLDRQDIVGRTKNAIIGLLPAGHASVDDAANKLNTSVRTLRRKLGEKNVSFKDLLAETRRELGERYIRDGSLSLTEVAFLLGFSDSSSFSRAYKTWTGQTPSEFRHTHVAS